MGLLQLPGTNSIFYFLLDSLADNHIFNKQLNVLPFTPSMKDTFTDFVAQPMGTLINVYLNGIYVLQTTVQDGNGLVSFEIQLPYTRGVDNTIELRLNSTGATITTTTFSTYSLYLFYEVFAKSFQTKEDELTRVKGDHNLLSARASALYPNFGILFDLRQRFDQTSEQYRDVLESFFIAFLNGGTNKGITTAIHDLDGVDPEIQPFREITGLRVYDSLKYTLSGPNVIDNDPTRDDHCFAKTVTTLSATLNVGATILQASSTKDLTTQGSVLVGNDTILYTAKNDGLAQLTINTVGVTTSHPIGTVVLPVVQKASLDFTSGTQLRVLPPIKPFSILEKGNGIYVIVNLSDITVFVNGEPLVKGGLDSTDTLSSRNLTVDLVIITQGTSTFTEGVEFTVNRLDGTITWLTGQPQPATGSTYFVTYKFLLIDAIKKVISQLKPSHRKVLLKITP